MIGRRFFLAGSLALSSCAAGSWSTRLPSGPAMKDGETVATPFYWRSFVERYPDQASVAERALLPLDAVTHEEMYRTNAFWNTKIRFLRDHEERFDCFSRDDIGRIPVRGDCEDFALSKRRELRGKFPDYAGCFRLAICEPYGRARRRLVGQSYYLGSVADPLHAVLTVDTTGGTVVLDMRGANDGGSGPYNFA
jgi:predicted transglutaminase-like cysteine proteinase